MRVSFKRALVTFTPLVGALTFPVVVPLVLRGSGLPAAVLCAVVLGTIWFVAMLRTAEMPSGH